MQYEFNKNHFLKQKKELKLTNKNIADFLGLSKEAVDSWGRILKNGIAKPKFDDLPKLAELLKTKLENLADNDFIKNNLKKNELITQENTYKIGVLEMVAGFGTEGVLDANFKIDYELNLPKELLGSVNPKYAKIIRCLGDSMLPEFENNDYLLIEMLENRHFIKRAGIYLVRVNDSVYIKRVEFLPDGDARLISINPHYATFQPLKDYGMEYEILGAVYGKISVKIGASFQFDNQGLV